MNELIITKERIDEFRNYLRLEEKSENTIEKYNTLSAVSIL